MRKLTMLMALLGTILALTGVRADEEIVLPMARETYVIGELVPVALGAAGELIDPHRHVMELPTGPQILETASLAPGAYILRAGGAERSLHLVSAVRNSPGALTDEVLPTPPSHTHEHRQNPGSYEAALAAWRETTVQTLAETGINAILADGVSDFGYAPILDLLARGKVLVFPNLDTRPMSFHPPRIWEPELASYRQRLAITAQLNGRFPTYGGQYFNWDPVGFFSRKGLMTYWQWGDQEGPLRAYIERSEEAVREEFRRRTGLEPVTEREFLVYTLSIGKPEWAPAIDLPTREWVDAIAAKLEPLPDAERIVLETRIDAWAEFLMGIYRETYEGHIELLDQIESSWAYTTSVQIDHQNTREGQYHPYAYQPLDFHYMSMWNDQIGGPDFAYQWVFSAAMLDAWNPREKPVWGGHALGVVHDQSPYIGKFVRAIAHNLAYNGSGAGFALEAFSNILGGMNKQTNWAHGAESKARDGVLAGRDFLNRFATLATEAEANHGVGILYSRSQRRREPDSQRAGSTAYKAFVSLLRLGYTPRFVTEEELEQTGELTDVKALVVFYQTVQPPEAVMGVIGNFVNAGGQVVVDAATTVAFPEQRVLPVGVEWFAGGRPYNWTSPNTLKDEHHIHHVERWHAKFAEALYGALGTTGQALLAPANGADTRTTVSEINGGKDITYVIAINDSFMHTHADWHQLNERLQPTREMPSTATVYDLNKEQQVGPFGAIEADLTRTTARVFAVTRQPLAPLQVSASQTLQQGDKLRVAVRLAELEGIVPFVLSLIQPDGKVHDTLYRATAADGKTTIELPTASNAPTGEWQISVRCQLTGEQVHLPVQVGTREQGVISRNLVDPVITRDTAGIQRILREGNLLIPVYADALHQLARQAAESTGGELRVNPAESTYWLAYTPTAEQAAENARADAGESIGTLKRTTINRNDYFAVVPARRQIAGKMQEHSGYRVGRHLLLLDQVGVDDNPLAEHLMAAGALWPEVSAHWPGAGKAVVQAVHLPYSPHHSVIVIQAADREGLEAGVAALRENLPDDWISTPVADARRALLAGLHIAGKPSVPSADNLTANGLRRETSPVPFQLTFRNEQPMTAEEIQPRPPRQYALVQVPGVALPENFVPQVRLHGQLQDAWTPGGNWAADLRFAHAIKVYLHVQRDGTWRVEADGQFRYSDRRPRSQAQWEDLLALRDEVVSSERGPMSLQVLVNGRSVGVLTPSKRQMRDVPVNTLPFYSKLEPEKVAEELVTELSGDVTLPAGRHFALLIPNHIVDGKIERLRFGLTEAQADRQDD